MRDMYFQSCWHSEFLQNAPISVSVWYWINSEFPRSSYSCKPPGSPSNSCQDEWRLSLTKTWTTPYQNIGLHCFHCKCWATCNDSQLLLRKLENLRQVLVIWDHHVVKLCLCVHRQHQFFRAGRVRRFIPVSLFPRVCMLSVFLSPHLRIFDWILALVCPHRFPGAGLTASFFIGLHPDWLDLSDLAEGSSSHSTGCATPDSQFSTSPPLASVSPSVNLHWKSLLASLWHGTLFPDRIWKKIVKMAARGHSRNSSCWTNWDSPWEECVFAGTQSTFDNWSTSGLLLSPFLFPETKLVGVFVLALLLEWSPVQNQFPGGSPIGLVVLFVERNTSITTAQRSRPSSPSIRKTSIQRNDFTFCSTVGYWRFTSGTCGNAQKFKHAESQMQSVSARTVLSVSANMSFTRPGLCDSCAACSFLLLSLACRPCTKTTSGTWTWCALPKYTSRSITWPSTSSRTPGTKATDCGTRTFTMRRWRRRWKRCAPTPRNWTSTRRCCRAARVSEAQAAGQLTGQFWWWTNEKTTQCIPQPRTHHKPFSFTSLFSSFLFLILVLCIISTLTLSLSLSLSLSVHEAAAASKQDKSTTRLFYYQFPIVWKHKQFVRARLAKKLKYTLWKWTSGFGSKSRPEQWTARLFIIIVRFFSTVWAHTSGASSICEKTCLGSGQPDG